MNKLNCTQGGILLNIARAAIAEKLDYPDTFPDMKNEPWLDSTAATFVTLKKDGELRGCIGSLKAYQSLFSDLSSNAVSAAFRDPRFPTLTREEFKNIRIEISVLTEPEEISFSSESDALSQLRPGIDGVIFECGNFRSTFLPQVWEQLTSPELFMAHLKQKAGLAPDFWSDEVQISRYGVEKFAESEDAE